MQAKIEDLQANFDAILQLVGAESYVNWEIFTKSTSQLTKSVDHLIKALTEFRELQQKRFLDSMKKMKSTDIPDLIKTVKAKKLPRQALKSILNRFKISDNKITLTCTTQSLKVESDTIFNNYVQTNKLLCSSLVQTNELLQQQLKINNQQEQPQPKELVSTFKHQFSKEKISEVCKSIPVQPQAERADLINIHTYGQIVQNTFDVVKDQYIRLTLQSRQNQRKLLGNAGAYVNSIVQYLTNTQVLILEGQRAIVKQLGLTQEKVQQSEVHLMQRGLAQTILLIQSGLRTRVKESVESEKPVDFEKTKEIIKFQIAMVKQKTPFFKIMLSSLEKTPQNFQILPLVIALTLNDYVWDKYGLEEEDFMKCITDQIALNNPQISAIFKDMEKAIITLMTEAGVINQDMAKVMEMQSEQIQKQMAEMGLGNIPSGIFPGSNPNDLLQQAQKSQFQQMKKK